MLLYEHFCQYQYQILQLNNLHIMEVHLIIGLYIVHLCDFCGLFVPSAKKSAYS